MGVAAAGSDIVRVFFLIRSLNYGGAQRQLITLVRALDPARFAVTVASFYDGGGLRAELMSTPGVRVISLGKAGRWDGLPFLVRLLRAVRVARPHVVHGYMSGANELALLAGRLAGARVVWGLRNAMREGAADDWLAAGIFRCGAWLSGHADLIIANSHAGRRFHIARRYAGRRMTVVANGIDTERFRPCPDEGAALRRAWSVAAGETLLGCVGRLDPQKDIPLFLRAAAGLARRHPRLRFVCVGAGEPGYTHELQNLAKALGLAGRIVWAGAHDAMPAVYSALDLLVSTSRSEGFANVIGEAMACGTPCVVTDAGDSALVVGDAGLVTPPQAFGPLLAALELVLAMSPAERAALGRRGRKRIEGEFSVSRMVERTGALLREVGRCAD